MQCQRALLYILCLGQVYSLILAKDSKEDLRRKFFRADPTSPKDTLDMLLQLRDYYAKSSDSIDKNDKARMDGLIRASELEKSKCNLEDLIKAKARMDAWSGFEGNVIPYLRHYLREQFLVCKTKLESELKDKVASFNEEDMQAINELMDDISSTNPNGQSRYVYLVPTAIEQGLAKYLKRTTVHDGKDLKKIMKDEKLFEVEFDRSIIELCTKVGEHFEDPLNIFDLFEDDSSILEVMSSDTIGLMEKGRLCKIVKSRRAKYSKFTLGELGIERSEKKLALGLKRLLCEFQASIQADFHRDKSFNIFGFRKFEKEKICY